ncbi:MAG: hypothetical protein CSYNP_03111 [Syntrophus sp. SKADARSKE-3]|nr:hypothetical protein [Syntrophus sp. SKADARSKE-3]
MKKLLGVLLRPFQCVNCQRTNWHFIALLVVVILFLSYWIGYYRHAFNQEWNVATFTYHKNNVVMKNYDPVEAMADYFKGKWKPKKKGSVKIQDLRTGEWIDVTDEDLEHFKKK